MEYFQQHLNTNKIYLLPYCLLTILKMRKRISFTPTMTNTAFNLWCWFLILFHVFHKIEVFTAGIHLQVQYCFGTYFWLHIFHEFFYNIYINFCFCIETILFQPSLYLHDIIWIHVIFIGQSNKLVWISILYNTSCLLLNVCFFGFRTTLVILCWIFSAFYIIK